MLNNDNYRIKEEIDDEITKKQNDKYCFILLLLSFILLFINMIFSLIFSLIAIFGYGLKREKNIYLFGNIMIVLTIILTIVSNMK